MEHHAFSAGLQMMQNWEEGTIHQIGALPFRGPGQAGESFQKEHQEIQQLGNVESGEE